MTIRKKKTQGKMVIDLTGPDGNAWVLMGVGSRLAKQLSMNYKPIQEDMMSGDYEHLLEVFDQHFGDYVILER